MKLRILGNRLRFRLTQEEVKKLCNGEMVMENTTFPTGNTLSYQMGQGKNCIAMTSDYSDNKIKITIPIQLLDGWYHDDRVGLYHTFDQGFEVAIEKDFQCLHKRPGEDESDNYPNPLKS